MRKISNQFEIEMMWLYYLLFCILGVVLCIIVLVFYATKDTETL